MIVAGHQPVFLPYSGYWFKLHHADIMDVRWHAQYTERSWQRRVKMRDKMTTLPLDGKFKYEPISKVMIDLPAFRTQFPKIMHGRYSGSKHYKTRGKDLTDFAMSLESPYLWEFNLDLLVYVRDLLGITTPFSLGVDTVGDKAEGVLSWLQSYPDVDTYLSGTGARAYMGDTTIFDEAGIKVEWVNHKLTTTDSVVTLLMDYDDPMEIILMEGSDV